MSMANRKCPGTAISARIRPTNCQSSPPSNKYITFSSAAKPMPTHAAYTSPSKYSSKCLLRRKNSHSTNILASSSGNAAPKKAILNDSIKPTASLL